jgi:sugar phosphate isomerase/epimerase
MNRRTFLKTSSSIVTGAALTAQLQTPLMASIQKPSNPYSDSIGLQLWTVRDQLAADNRKTLKAIADAGYKQVELMDTTQAKDLLPICKELGLNVTSAFMNWAAICNPDAGQGPSLDEIIEQSKSADLKHLVFGYIAKGFREKADQYKQHAENANKFGDRCKKAGMKLCYHNHAFEFEKLADADGKCGYDILIKELDKELCPFELDVFWIAIGGWEPIATLKQLKGRVSQVHLKDLKAGTPTIYDEGKVPVDAFEELGDGMIAMDSM